LQLVSANSAGDLGDLNGLLREAEVFAPGEEPRKWIPGCTTGKGAEALEDLHARGLLPRLRAVGKAGIGFVSGANDFFVLRPSEARARQIPTRSLVPCIIKARQLPGISLRPSDVAELERADEKCLLWLPEEPLNAREKVYEARGRASGISERYKCRVRTPWYRVPGVHAPHAFLTYMSDAFPRLCLNEAGIMAANTLLVVNLPAVPRNLLPAFVAAFYNSATLLSCELTGRSYGGGVLKLEPREADQILVPDVALVRRVQDDLGNLLERVNAALRTGRADDMDHAIQQVDEIVLVQGCGLSPKDVEEMRAIGSDLRERRRSRKPSRRASATTCLDSL
jgi:hypothetical protein